MANDVMAPAEKKGRRTTLVTLQEASAEHGIPYMTLRQLVINGVIPRVQLGDVRRYWVRRADLDRLIAGR